MQEFNRLLSSIKGAEIAPIYLLAGKEPYFIDRIDHQLCEALIDDASRDFDQTIFYGKEICWIRCCFSDSIGKITSYIYSSIIRNRRR